MGEKRRKEAYQQRIRNGEFRCVYCGGVQPACEPDHMPPRVLFSRKQRPNDLVFPSCKECNRSSSAIDVVISWLGRMYPDSPDERERAEVLELGRSMRENFPEVASAFYSVNNITLTATQQSALPNSGTPMNV